MPSWVTADGSTGEISALTDGAGVVLFSIAVPPGEAEFTAWAGGVASNPTWVTGN